MALLIPNATATTSGNKYAALDQAEPDSLDFEVLGNRTSGVLPVSGVMGCAVTSVSSATNVAVAAGTIVLSGTQYAVAANGAFSLGTAPTNKRFDLVVARVSGGVATLTVVKGNDDATNPTYPASANVITGAFSATTNIDLSTDVILAAVYRQGSTTIATANIVDKRVPVSTTSISDQGTTNPISTYGSGTGAVFYQTNSSSGTSSGVWVKTTTGAWMELAQNVGAHLPIGGVFIWPSQTASLPPGCLECNGQALSTSTYPALFSVLGYTFGGSGGTFNLPNYNDTFIRGTTTLTSVGATGGSATTTFHNYDLPSHYHSLTGSATSGHTHDLGNHAHHFGHGHSNTVTFSDHSHTLSATATVATHTGHTHGMGYFNFLTQTPSYTISSSNRVILTYDRTPSSPYDVIYYSPQSVTGTGGSHTHALGGSTDNASLSATVSLPKTSIYDAESADVLLTPSTGSAITSAASGNTSAPTGITDYNPSGGGSPQGTGFTVSNPIPIIPPYSYARYLIRASLGSDGTAIGSIAIQPVTAASVSFTIGAAHAEQLVRVTGTITVTVPNDTAYNFPVGSRVSFVKMDTGTTTTFAGSSGVTVRSKGSVLTMTGTSQYGQSILEKIGANEWVLYGSLG